MLSTSNHTINKDHYQKSTFPPKPFQLVSLWEMYQMSLGPISAVSGILTMWEAKISSLINMNRLDPMLSFADAVSMAPNFNNLKSAFKTLENHVMDLDLKSTGRLAKEIMTDIDKARLITIKDNLGKLINIMESELCEKYVLYVPEHQAAWITYKIFPDSVTDAFPSTADEIKEACNCYALDRPTACVFHSMRILEYGLCALANDVGLEFDKQQWHTIIVKIESVIKELRNLPQGKEKDERLQFLSEAAKEFMYFKDGWRNHVTHRRIIYDPPQAVSILSHTKAFMEHISKMLKESDKCEASV
jgi:hypothetical protein